MKVSIAPMIRYTTLPMRCLLRLLNRRCVIYTEMVVVGRLLNNPPADWIKKDATLSPVILQIAGNDPTEMAEAAEWGEEAGYSGININLGCPSHSAQMGGFGAVLMQHPYRIAKCIKTIRHRVSIPISVKLRLGVDSDYEFPRFLNLIDILHASGADSFIVHARKAYLRGVNPRQNRSIPPLDYSAVHQLKEVRKNLHITLNGGITSVESVNEHLKHVDAVMIGRKIVQDPWFLLRLEGRGVDNDTVTKRLSILEEYLDLYDDQHSCMHGHRFYLPLFGLFRNIPGALVWRKNLSERSPCRNRILALAKNLFAYGH